jgi:tetratricopeptide (TPR) repeat protein
MKPEEITKQITKDVGISTKKLSEELEFFLNSARKISKLLEDPKTIINQLSGNRELDKEAIRIYYNSLIKTLHKFINVISYHWKTIQSINQFPEAINNIREIILEELNNFLTYFEKEHVHLLRHIAELEDYSGKFERANENVFKAIWQNMQDMSLDEKILKDIALMFAISSGDYKFRLFSLKDRYSKLLKDPAFAIQKIEEIEKIIEKFIAQKEIIKTSSEAIRQAVEEIGQFVKTKPQDLTNLSSKVEYLCGHLDVIGGLIEEKKEGVPIPLREINDKCLDAISEVAKMLPKNLAKEYTKILLKINDRLLKYFSTKASKRFLNLFDKIEYLRLHESLWDEFGFKETIKEAYKLGEKIYGDINFHKEYSDQKKLEAFLGQFGEICRSMVEFECCNPAEKRNLLLKSNDLLQKSMMRDSKPVIKYFGRNYLRMGYNYMDLKLWEDAIRCFMNIKDIDSSKKVDKKIAFMSRVNIADCYLNLALEAKKFGDINGTFQNFELAEKFYRKAEELPKSGPDDDRYLLGKMANFYFLSQQYEKALPFYSEIMQREADAPLDEKNLYDCFSYRWGECLYMVGNIYESTKQFETTLKRNPIKEHRIKSYAWLIKLYVMGHNWDKLNEIKDKMLNDEEIQGISIHGISTDKLDVLLMSDKMEEYIKYIDYRLARGDHWAVIDEMKDIIKLHKLLEGHDDPVLLTKLAEADIRAGDYVLALKTLHYIMELDSSPKNHSYALSLIGRVYMEQGEYLKSINAFEESFKLGGDIGVISLQAAAYRKLKEYDLSIRKFEQILRSGKDKKPYITKTGLAKTYWDKYQDRGKREDIVNALRFLREVINDHPEDWRAYDLLVRMSNDPIVLDSLESFIRECPIIVDVNILRALNFEDAFPEKAIAACLKRLSLINFTDTDYWPLVQSSADFLMRATIYSYFFSNEDSFNANLKGILSCILNLPDRNSILIEYLCAEKGAYPDFFEQMYAMKVENILEPLSRDNTDLNLTLNEVIQSVKEFIQSEVPEDIKVLYRGLETKGVDLSNMLIKRFGEVKIHKEGYKCILKHPNGIQPSMEIPYPAWHMFEKLTDWFFPLYSEAYSEWIGKGIWKDIFYESTEVMINLETREVDKIEIRFVVELAYADEHADSFKIVFEATRNNHRVCPIPQMPWFRYTFSESLIEEENRAVLTVIIEMPRCVKLKGSLLYFIPFLDYMTSSFKGGLCGNFKPEEYRKKAANLFPTDIYLDLEQWVDFIHIYLDSHFGILFDAVLRDEQYRNTIHIYIKRPLQWISAASEQKEITDFLANVKRLPWELGRVRRRRLESITTKSSIRKLNIEKILENLINNLKEKNPEISFEFFPSRCKIVDGIEPLLKRAFMELYNNAIFATKALKGPKIQTFVFEEEDYCVIRIHNPFKETIPSSPFSTQIGLKSARFIIENEHKGRLKTVGISQQGVFISEVKLPFDVKERGI